jgi:hypothetical protein
VTDWTSPRKLVERQVAQRRNARYLVLRAHRLKFLNAEVREQNGGQNHCCGRQKDLDRTP